MFTARVYTSLQRSGNVALSCVIFLCVFRLPPVFAVCLVEQQNAILSSRSTRGTSQTVNDGVCIPTRFLSTFSELFMRRLISSQNSGLATTGCNTQGASMTSPVYTDWPKCSDFFHLISLAHFCLRRPHPPPCPF